VSKKDEEKDEAKTAEPQPEFKFQVLQTNLAPAIGKVARAVATRSTLPVLSNILVMALPEQRLRIVATNLEVAIVAYVSAKVEVSGGTTLPARAFADLVGTLPDEELLKFSLKARTETTTIKHGAGKKKGGEINLRGIVANEFPLLPAHDIVLAKISGDLLAKVIGKAVPCAAEEQSRPILTGVLMHFKKSTVTLAASDGFRLAVAHLKLSEPVEKECKFIVPARVLAEVARLLGKDPTVTININANKTSIQFVGESTEVMSQLIDGTFPDYTQIMPKKHDTQVTLTRKELLKKVKAALVFARESANIIKLSVESDWLGISAVSAETGDSDDGIEVAVSGEPLVFALNGHYVLQVLESTDAERVVIRGTTASSPFTFRDEGDDNGDLFVIMPMHLGERVPAPANAAAKKDTEAGSTAPATDAAAAVPAHVTDVAPVATPA